MVKAYLRYNQAACFGVINSLQCPVVYDWIGKHAITGGLDAVLVWNLRQGNIICTMKDPENTSEVTAIALSPDRKHIAAGYADGKVRIWQWSSGFRNVDAPTTLSGHRSGVSALHFIQEDTEKYSKGQLLCSGSRDGKLVVWDTIEQRGLFRLQGHKGEITECRFLGKSSCLLSSSKDTLMKLWDLETQHCTQTLVGHRKEVWSFTVDQEEKRLYTGTSDHFFRVYEFVYPVPGSSAFNVPEIKPLGNIPREGKERVIQLRLSPSGRLLICQAANKVAELFNVFEAQDISRRRRRRMSRAKKKQEERAEEANNDDQDPPEFMVTDEVAPAYSIKLENKISSCCFSPTQPQLLFGLSNNSLDIYDLQEDSCSKSTEIALPGHRSDVRSVALSSDDSLLVSTSQDHTKIWNIHSRVVIRTIESGYGLCSTFLPGNRHVLIGTKEGSLELYEVASGNLLEEIEAHKGEVWSIALQPDQQGLVSGGADKKLKFWEFRMQKNENGKRVLALVHTKTITMEDDILAIVFSANMKLLAVALLDNTVKVFHADTMNFFLSLYGHKLPVLALDISSDGTTLVTASADKNIKLWGLDFGDCHRSLFAHDDSVMQVKFVPNTHYFFTAGKDKMIKYWDGDTYEKVLSLSGHQGDIWGLVISADGEFLVSSSRDRSIRIWERSREQVFIDEERESELEKIFEASLEDNQPSLEDGARESAIATTRNLATIKAGEFLIEAIEEAEKDKMKWVEYENTLQSLREMNNKLGKRTREQDVAKPKPSVLFQNRSASDFVLSTLKSIPSNDLEQSLLTLSFSEVINLFSHIEDWIKRNVSTELSCRVMFFLLKAHHHQIVSNRTLLMTLTRLQQVTKQQLKTRKNIIGFNRAAMSYLERGYEQAQQESLFFEVTKQIGEKQANKKRKLH